MIGEPRLDYVFAGVIYLVAGRKHGGETRPETVESLTAAFDKWFHVSMPSEVIAVCLRRLAQAGVFSECKTLGGMTSFQPLAGGEKWLIDWEMAEEKNVAQAALEKYRNSGPDWLTAIYNLPGFFEDLEREILLSEKAREWGSDEAATEIVLSEDKREEVLSLLGELERMIADAELTQSEKCQAQSIVRGTINLATAPTPPWRTIIDLLGALGSLAGIGAFAIELTKVILQGHM